VLGILVFSGSRVLATRLRFPINGARVAPVTAPTLAPGASPSLPPTMSPTSAPRTLPLTAPPRCAMASEANIASARAVLREILNLCLSFLLFALLFHCLLSRAPSPGSQWRCPLSQLVILWGRYSSLFRSGPTRREAALDHHLVRTSIRRPRP
jgi:hypothetical protein